MNQPLLHIQADLCTLCFSCVRACPVKAIEIKSEAISAKILNKRCIECGDCYLVCPEKAIKYASSLGQVKSMLDSDTVTVAILAPSSAGEFQDILDYRKFVKMCHSLGFDYIKEMSFGVDLVALKYRKLFLDFKGKYYFSSNCPVTLNHIEKYHPDLLGNLAPIPSPMIMSATVAREMYGQHVNVVHIGPCIAAKNEGFRYPKENRPNAVITFEELRELFRMKGISEKQVEYADFDSPLGNKGGLYAIGEGFLEAENIDTDLLKGDVVTIQGKDDFLESISHFENHAEQIKKDFNIFYCGGCIMGPGTCGGGKKYVRRSAVIQYVKKRIKDLNIEEWKSDIKKFEGLNPLPKFEPNDQRIKYNETEIVEILVGMGKTHSDHYKGCSLCGYKSCRELAIAVSKGLAETEMCVFQNFSNRQELQNKQAILISQLDQTEVSLRKFQDAANKERQISEEAQETILTLLHELPSAVVIVDHEMKILQANRNFVKTIGPETEEIQIQEKAEGLSLKNILPLHFHKLFYYVMEYNESIIDRDIYINKRFFNVSIFTIKKGSVVGCILRDMYLPEVQKEQVVSRVNEVLGINFSMVQKIGLLLGEGAAETEHMLNSIVESYNNDKKYEVTN